MATIRVIEDTCIGCSLCVEACPVSCISLEDEKAVIGGGCTFCGACVDVCPVEAIEIIVEEKRVDVSGYSGVLVFGEQDSTVAPVVYELLGKGRELADKLGEDLTCIILGHNMKAEAEEISTYGVDKVYLYDSQDVAQFRDDPYVEILSRLVEEIKPSIFLIGATPIGRSLAPRLATRLKTGLTADCTGLDIDKEGNLRQTRPAYGGNVMATIITPNHRPQMATVRYKVMKKAEKVPGHVGEIILREVEKSLNDRTRIRKTSKVTDEKSITDAEFIVSGGKGLGTPEGFKLLKELADAVGGAIGASRIAVDQGWIDYSHQVGLSGKTVRPRVYIACGISGAVQHLAGMQTSDIIIAINKDPSASIFKVADYGIVGDLYDVVPELIRQLTASS